MLANCASSSSTGPATSTGEACARQLAPRSVPRPTPQPQPPVAAPPSRLIVHAELPLAKLGAELERHIAPQLASGRNVKIGPAGVLNYSVDRGAFALAIADGNLVVETPVQGRAEACSGRRCYAACEPRALVRAEIPLWLRSDYRFDRSRVSLEFTTGCKVRALGGMLRVDITPMLKSALAPQLERVRREIDGRLPDVRGAVERGWRELSRPRELPLGGCVVVEPLGFVQGPMRNSRRTAHARFALLARPELRTDCSERKPNVPLPPLSADPALPEEDTLTLGMELPLTSLARAFEAAAPEAGAGPRFRVVEAEIEARAQRVAAELTLAGELCGVVALQAEPSFAGEAGFIELMAGKFEAAERDRVRTAGLDPDVLARELARSPRLAAPFSLPMLRAAPPALASMFSDPKFSLSARVSSLRAAGAAARRTHLIAWVEARGSLLLVQK